MMTMERIKELLLLANGKYLLQDPSSWIDLPNKQLNETLDGLHEALGEIETLMRKNKSLQIENDRLKYHCGYKTKIIAGAR